jgi:hypothetical protein
MTGIYSVISLRKRRFYQIVGVSLGVLLLISLLIVPVIQQQWSDESRLLEYETRLWRVLDGEAVTVAPVIPPALPSVRQLSLALSDAGNINILDMLGLDQCALGEVIARRNSSLGKVAGSSGQLLQTREFMLLAPSCIRQLQDENPSLAATLQQALSVKYQDRLRFWWNAWVAGPEWRGMSSLSAPLLSFDEQRRGHLDVTLKILEEALRQQQRWQSGELEADDLAVHLHTRLQQLLQGESVGRWLVTQVALTASLNRINQMLAERQQHHPLCPSGRQTPRAEIVQNVLLRFYIGQLQPYMSATDQFGQSLLPLLDQFWPSGLAAEQPPPSWRLWLQGLHSTRDNMLAASRQHVQQMTAILASCGMAPGQSDVD